MKIGIVCPYNPFMPGGVQAHIAHQTAELRRRGHKVVLVTPRPRNFSEAAPDGVVFIGQSTRINGPQHTSAEVSMSVDTDVIDQVLETEKFELVHVHEPLIPILSLQLLQRLECPTIGTFHAALPDTFLAKSIAGSIGLYKRSIYKHLDTITAVSQAATSYLADGVEKHAVHIIPNGIDLDDFDFQDERGRDENTVAYVGRLEKRKGVRYLLDAFAILAESRPDAQLIIAGDGPESNMLKARARSLGLKRVHFLGQISDQERRKLLATCTVFTSPALYGESFGIVLLEAMAAGAVTVAGANPGYTCVLTGTGRLSLVDSRSSAEYARRLDLLMSDKKLRAVWRTWARDEIVQYGYPNIVDRYVELYGQLVPATA